VFPGFDSFSCVDEPHGTSGGWVNKGHREVDQSALARGDLSSLHRIVVYYCGRRAPGDFIWTQDPLIVIVSDRVKQALESNGLTGWRTYPVQLRDESERTMLGFSGLTITGRCGSLDWSRSLPVLRTYRSGTFANYRGIFFREDSWDGSDLFMPEDLAWMFTSERFSALAQKLRLRNAKFRKLSTAEVRREIATHSRAGYRWAG